MGNVCMDRVDDRHVVHVRARHHVVIIHGVVVQQDNEIHGVDVRQFLPYYDAKPTPHEC